MSLLTLSRLTVQRSGRRVLDGVTMQVEAGDFVGLVGPNGAGKTTLLRAALNLLPHGGTSSLDALSHDARARHAAWLPQMREIAWPLSVEAVIALGRTPYGDGRSPTGAAAVEAAISRMDLEDIRRRTATQLSGGEQARVLIARALAQETPLVLADEPIAGLDPAHQIAAMEVFAQLAASGYAVVASLHDLGLSARFCTHLAMLHDGRLVAEGRPAEVLNEERLARVFGIRAYFKQSDEGPIFQPLARLRE